MGLATSQVRDNRPIQPPAMVEITVIQFETIHSGLTLDGERLQMYPTAADAITAFCAEMARLREYPRQTLYWRKEPELNWERDFERNEEGWTVRARLGVGPW